MATISLNEALLEIDGIKTKEGLIDLLERIDISSKNTSAGAKTVFYSGMDKVTITDLSAIPMFAS